MHVICTGFGVAMIMDITYELNEFDSLADIKKLWPQQVCTPVVSIQAIKRRKKSSFVGECYERVMIDCS